jgi:hypothetical protein
LTPIVSTTCPSPFTTSSINNIPVNEALKLGQHTVKFVGFVETGAVFVCRLFDGVLPHRRSNSNKLMESNKNATITMRSTRGIQQAHAAILVYSERTANSITFVVIVMKQTSPP